MRHLRHFIIDNAKESPKATIKRNYRDLEPTITSSKADNDVLSPLYTQ